MSVTIPMPFAPVGAAAALWHTTPEEAMGSSSKTGAACAGPPVGALVPPTLQESTCRLGVITLGAPLLPDDNEVCFDPRKVRLVAPPFPDLPRGPKTQFAPSGPVVMEALDIGFPPGGPCVCRARGQPCFIPTSLAALLCTVRNGVRVQRALAAAGVIHVAPALAKATDADLPCFCTALGSDVDIVASFFQFCSAFSDTPAITLQDPAEYVRYLNTVFTQQTLASIQHQVITAAAINYARAEPNVAYVTFRPSAEEAVFDRNASYTAMGKRAQDRLLADPISTPARRAELAAVTGLPVGGAVCSSSSSKITQWTWQ